MLARHAERPHLLRAHFRAGRAALLAYLLYLVLSPLAQPIAWALFIAFLLHPLHRWLTRKLRGRAAFRPRC